MGRTHGSSRRRTGSLCANRRSIDGRGGRGAHRGLTERAVVDHAHRSARPGRGAGFPRTPSDAMMPPLSRRDIARHPVPHAEFAGGRAPVGRPRTARSLWILGAVLLASAMAIAPAPARAASVLSNRHVSPGSGTTATVFTFSVDYNSSNPVRNAQAVWAEFGGTTVHARPRERQHARRDVGRHLDASRRQLAGDLPRIDLREPPTRAARWTERHRDVAATDADAGANPAAHSDADPSTDRRTDASTALADANAGSDAAARKHPATICPRSAADITARWE